MKLYLYEHCPFCVRPRIVSGVKNIELELKYLANDDEKAHWDKIGKKQVPFLQKGNGQFLIESLDICTYFNQINDKQVLAPASADTTLVELIAKLSKASKSFVYPRFLDHPLNRQDFPTQSAKDYFQRKKEKYIGCFKANFRFPEAALMETSPLLAQINTLMHYQYATGEKLSWDDIIVFPILRNLTIAEDILALPDNINRYVHFMSDQTKIALYTKHDYSAWLGN
ncbi:glutaredoxin 2 [Facilibium subflavum]|uniref:glutaredoxin 2 n=1 Tax=Facilibium subflavum TaxID=2219058 RepID=UPI000E6564BC|nr:glutaredoxin 2 [Facilibium subflavum]